MFFFCAAAFKVRRNKRLSHFHGSSISGDAAHRLWHLCLTVEFMLCQVPHRLRSLSVGQGSWGNPWRNTQLGGYWIWREKTAERVVRPQWSSREWLHHRCAKRRRRFYKQKFLFSFTCKEEFMLLNAPPVVALCCRGIFEIFSFKILHHMPRSQNAQNAFACSLSSLVHINALFSAAHTLFAHFTTPRFFTLPFSNTAYIVCLLTITTRREKAANPRY